MDEDKTVDQTQESTEVEESATESAATETQEQNEETQEETQEQEQETETEGEQESETEAESEGESEEAEKPTSPRVNKRIEQLTKKLADSKKSQQPSLTNSEKNELIESGEYSIEELNEKFQQGRNQAYSEGLAQAKAIEFKVGLEIDGPKVAQKYDILDADSDNFDPGRAAFINELYLRTVGYDHSTGTVENSGIRYGEFVDGIMELVDAQATAKTADSRKNLVKQVAKTGVRPGGVSKPAYTGNDPRKMTDAQLTAAINQGLGLSK